MRTTRRRFLAVVSSFGLGAGLVAAVPAVHASAQTDGITIAIGSEPTSLDPHAVDDGGERAINDNVYETLLSRTAAGELVPMLATALPTAVDDTTWEFDLRDGVTFHDGTPFNADAVVATVNRIIRMSNEKKTDLGIYDVLAGATKVDDDTVRIATKGPDALLSARLTWLKIVAPSAEQQDDISEASNGTGPYVFGSRQTGVSVSLTANPKYWGGAPKIASVTFEFVSEPSTRLAGLKSGKYDLITNLAPAFVKEAPKVAKVLGQEHPVVILNADGGITADKNVRLALNLAIDRATIVDAVYGGFAVVDPGQYLSPPILGFNPAVQAYPYDPDQAKQLIKEAGAEGKTITLVGESSGRWLNDKDLVELIAGYWTEAGLNVDLQTPEFSAYLDVLFNREARPDSIFVSSSNDILDADRQLTAEFQKDGIEASNSDAEMSALIDQARAELDTTKREALYHQVIQHAHDQAYFVNLVNNEDIYGTSTRLEFTPRVDSKIIVGEMSLAG